MYGMGVEYCGEHVCVFVCLSASISPKLDMQIYTMLPMAVARSSSSAVVIRYVPTTGL